MATTFGGTKDYLSAVGVFLGRNWKGVARVLRGLKPPDTQRWIETLDEIDRRQEEAKTGGAPLTAEARRALRTALDGAAGTVASLRGHLIQTGRRDLARGLPKHPGKGAIGALRQYIGQVIAAAGRYRNAPGVNAGALSAKLAALDRALRARRDIPASRPLTSELNRRAQEMTTTAAAYVEICRQAGRLAGTRAWIEQAPIQRIAPRGARRARAASRTIAPSA